MSYQIKEIFYSLQGEGFNSGRPAIFCRFTQCNLWTGREIDRENSICKFCDTDFIKPYGQNGGKFISANVLAKHLLSFWKKSTQQPFVILTGGEPLLQVNQNLIDALHEHKFEIAIETNGTLKAPKNIDWICVSPKAGIDLKIKSGNELKLVYPQLELHPKNLEHLEFDFFYLQPMNVQSKKLSSEFLEKTLNYCLNNPKWRLSLQTHKILGLK